MCDDLVAQVVQSLCPVDVTQSLASKQQDVEAILAIAASLPGGAAALSSRSVHPPPPRQLLFLTYLRLAEPHVLRVSFEV